MIQRQDTVGPPCQGAYRFLDADGTSRRRHHPEIFARDGEGLRRPERQVRITQPTAFWWWPPVWHRHRAGELKQLRQGVVIWLDVAEDELLRRLQADPGGRLLLAGEG